MIKIKERRKLLVDALRSGDYIQGRDQLRTEKGYCCLGVACDVYRQSQDQNSAWKQRNCGYSFLGAMNSLPEKVMEWFGFETDIGDYGTIDENGPHVNSLTELNDFDKMSFIDIANVIESEPEGMFRGHNKNNNVD